MRVAMVLRNPYTHDTRVEKEARTLRDAGYDVVVVAHTAPGLAAKEVRDGIAVVRVAPPARRVPFVRFALHARAMRLAVTRLRPDIVHAHDSDALEPAARAARGLDVPLVHDAHELWVGRPARGRPFWYRWAYRTWYRRVEAAHLPRAAAVLAVSPPIVAYLQRTYRLARVDLVPNYPEVGERLTPRDMRELSGAETIPPGAPIVLHLGGYQPDRGLEQLVAAVALLPAVHLVLLGIRPGTTPIDRLGVEQGISDRVHLLAPVPSDDVIAFAASASVGVMPILPTTPNNAASLPNKLFQYMAASLPVVATALPHLHEIVEESGAGTCVDTDDPGALADAIGRIVDNPVLADRMGSAGRRAVEGRYNWDAAAATLRGVYARIPEQATVQSPR
jgi:glycosyltransferase involved in cell wall biosynthesis